MRRLLFNMAAFLGVGLAATSVWALSWERTLVPRALVVEGLWAEPFRVGEALDRAGMRFHGNAPMLVKSGEQLSVVVLVNTPAARLSAPIMESLKAFVENGGGLVVLGGYGAYGNGAYAGTALEEMLPVQLKDSACGYSAPAPDGANLAPAAGVEWLKDVDFTARPAAFYYHTLIPKAGARVALTVGDQPAMVEGTFGKGRVLACALTVNGVAPQGVVPFWEWKEWPVLLAAAADWAAGARPPGATAIPRAAESGPKPVTEDEIASAELGLDALPKDFVKRAVAHPSERVAGTLLGLATADGGTTCNLGTVLPALLPYARADWAAKLEPKADAGNPDIESRKAALILLGVVRSPAAYATLMTALMDPHVELAAMDGLAQLGRTEAIPALKARFESALKPARVAGEPGRWVPAAFAAASLPAAHAATALYALGDPDGVPRLLTLARDVRLYHRILANASKRHVYPTDLQGMAILKGIREAAGLMAQAWAHLEGGVGPIPERQQVAVAAYAKTAEDPVEIELLAAAIEKSADRLAGDTAKVLAGARSGILARMGRTLTAGKQ